MAHGISGARNDLSTYMVRVKVQCSPLGVKTYGTATAVIKDCHANGVPVEKCVAILTRAQDTRDQSAAVLPQAAE